VAETPESLEALRAEFYKFERRGLNWKVRAHPLNQDRPPRLVNELTTKTVMVAMMGMGTQIGGVQVPEAVLWLMFFQCLGLPFYSGMLERNESIKFVRRYVERLESMGFPQGGGDDDDPPPVQSDCSTLSTTSATYFRLVNDTHAHRTCPVSPAPRKAGSAPPYTVRFSWPPSR
jgi:hypothetical protein